MGFEPTEHFFCSTAFRAVAITQTLPTLHGRREWSQTISVYICRILFYSAIMGAEVRLELTLYWLMRPVSLPLDYSAMVGIG